MADAADDSDTASVASSGEHSWAAKAADIDTGLEQIGVQRFHVWMVLVLGIGNASDAVELLGVTYILKNFVDRDGHALSGVSRSLVSAAAFGGMMVGGFAAGLASDAVGRKPVLAGALALNAAAGLCCAWAPTALWLAALRCAAGVGIGGVVPATFTLCAELSPPAARGFCLNCVAWFWVVGSLYVAALGYGCFGADWGARAAPALRWRAFAALAAAPALVACALALALPRSPQWLAAQGRHRQAAAVLQHIGRAFRRQPAALPSHVAAPLEEPCEGPVACAGGSVQEPRAPLARRAAQALARTRRVGQALLQRPLARPFLLQAVVWWAMSFGSYGISSWIVLIFEKVGVRDAYASAAIFAAGQIPGSVAAAWLIDYWGRKALLLVALSLSAVFALMFALGAAWSERDCVIAVACAFSSATVIGWQVLNCLSTEAFPTPLRSTAYGALATVGRLGSIGAQFVNGLLLQNVVALLLITSLHFGLAAAAALALPGSGPRYSAHAVLGAGMSDDDARA